MIVIKIYPREKSCLAEQTFLTGYGQGIDLGVLEQWVSLKTEAEKDNKKRDTEHSSRKKDGSATLQGLRRQRQHVKSKD